MNSQFATLSAAPQRRCRWHYVLYDGREGRLKIWEYYHCAEVRTNFYSVPLMPGSVVEARVYSSVVEFQQIGVRAPTELGAPRGT